MRKIINLYHLCKWRLGIISKYHYQLYALGRSYNGLSEYAAKIICEIPKAPIRNRQYVALYTRASTEPNEPTDGAWDGITLSLPTGWTLTDPNNLSAETLYLLIAELDLENKLFAPQCIIALTISAQSETVIGIFTEKVNSIQAECTGKKVSADDLDELFAEIDELTKEDV